MASQSNLPRHDGLRGSEVIGLRGKDSELTDGPLVIKYRRKGGKFTAREVSDPSAYEALKDYGDGIMTTIG